MTNFAAPTADTTGTTNDFSANVATYVDPVVNGLAALHLFGDTLAKSQRNLAPNIQSPPGGGTLGTGPTFNAANTTPKFMLTNGVAGGFELGVTDSANMTLIQAVFMPTPPTSGVGASYGAFWSTATGTAGFTLVLSTSMIFTAYTPSGNMAPAALALTTSQWNILSSTVDSTTPSAPVLTLRNHTAGTSVTTTGSHAVSPSGSLIYLGGTPASTSNNIGPVEHGFVKVHSVVLNPTTDLTNAVSYFRNVLAARSIIA